MGASGKRGGFMGWDKECEVGLGLKMQEQLEQGRSEAEAYPYPVLRSSQIYNNNTTTNSTTTSSSSSSRSPSGGLYGFPDQANAALFCNPLASNMYSGEGTRSVAFTAEQRQELERQTVIYKYMMASMPVPSELLIPVSRYPTALPSSSHFPLHSHSHSHPSEVGGRGGGGGRNGGAGGSYPSPISSLKGGGDAEPWRCRRTDGKKWRCSRDVAPDQKYCERHSHKARPSRSRKHVESPPPTKQSPSIASLPHFNHHPLPRYTEWFIKREAVHGGVSAAAPPLYQQEELRGESRKSARPFIDAWSLGDVHVHEDGSGSGSGSNSGGGGGCPVSSPINSILPLTLSMSAGGEDEDNRQGAIRSSQHQPLNWMSSWISSPPGGPLAEALCLGISCTTSNLTTAANNAATSDTRAQGSQHLH